MPLQTDHLSMILFLMMLLGSTQSGSSFNNGTNQEERPLNDHSSPSQVITAPINRTNRSEENTTPTTPFIASEVISSTTRLYGEEIVTSRPLTVHVSKSEKSSASPHADRAQKRRKQTHLTTLLGALLALAICLSAVGVVAAVFFVRRKRIKKMKMGFQEEMATICLHDELASEALYSSWKPFMETNESNKMKLVIETANQGGESSQISEHHLVE